MQVLHQNIGLNLYICKTFFSFPFFLYLLKSFILLIFFPCKTANISMRSRGTLERDFTPSSMFCTHNSSPSATTLHFLRHNFFLNEMMCKFQSKSQLVQMTEWPTYLPRLRSILHLYGTHMQRTI